MSSGGAIQARPAAASDQGVVRVAIVDDHAILRQGLRALLEMESDLEVVGEAADTQGALALVRETRPDIVLSDVALPGRSGLDIIGELRACCPSLRILVLTAHGSEEYIRVALNARADGYVLKESSREELLLAIRSVARGEQFLCKAVAARVLSDYFGANGTGGQGRPRNTLTERERQVLTCIARGLPNKKIARDLGLAVKTVEKHRSNLMRKLELHNTAEITMYAVRGGFVSPDDIRQA